MNRKISFVFYIFIFAASITVSWFYAQSNDRVNTGKCTANMSVYHDDIKANLTLAFMYIKDEKTGIVSVDGNYFINNNYAGSIRREVAYSWIEDKNNIQFTSRRITKLSNTETINDDTLRNILPDFYIAENKNMFYTIVNQGTHGFIMSSGNRAIIFCER